VLAQFLEYLVGCFLVVPESRIGGYFFQVVDFILAFVDVKDTSVTVPGDDRSPAVFLLVVQTLSFNTGCSFTVL